MTQALYFLASNRNVVYFLNGWMLARQAFKNKGPTRALNNAIEEHLCSSKELLIKLFVHVEITEYS